LWEYAIPKKADAEQSLQATHSRATPGNERVSLCLEFEKDLPFHEVISPWFKRELRKPVKNERLGAKLSGEGLHHERTGRPGRRFEDLGERTTRSSYLIVVQGHTKNCGLCL
jgi:hypothetical protein